jgi:hypothetical protein
MGALGASWKNTKGSTHPNTDYRMFTLIQSKPHSFTYASQELERLQMRIRLAVFEWQT